MKKVLTFFLVCIYSIYLHAQPTDNPVKTHYGNGEYPVWTDNIKWDNVIDMSSYAIGDNEFERFENARDELFNAGGGVLYYPGKAEPYDFSDMPANGKDGRGLMLKSGVVIRGEKPTDTIAIDGDLSLTTRFLFPTKLKEGEFSVPDDWAIIGTSLDETTGKLSDVKNVGVVWVQLEYGTLFFGSDINWGETYATAGAWKSSKVLPEWQDRIPDGTFPYDYFCGAPMNGDDFLGAGSGRLVFGCQFVNSTVTNDVYFDGYPGSTGYFNFKFGSRICIYASDVFVGNNSMPKPTASFQYRQVTQSSQEKILQFDYGLTHGIDINKQYLNIFSNKFEAYTQENVMVRDNYVWNHGRKGFELSGNYMMVHDNHNERIRLVENNNIYGLGNSWELTMDGWLESTNSGSGSVSDNLSRAYDMAGQNGWLHQNTFNNPGSNPGNDGEGILWQGHGGMNDIPSFVFSRNTYLGGVEKGHIQSYKVRSAGVLWIWNRTSATGNAHDSWNTYCNAVAVENYFDEGMTTPSGVNEEYFITECPSSTPAAPNNVQATLSEDNNYVHITWDDVAENEIGYRIDKSIGGTDNWELLVYRPAQGSDSANCLEFNVPEWKDFKYPKDVQVYYRVVAIDCNDDESGAGVVPNPLHVVTENPAIEANETITDCQVYPNPARDVIYLSIPITIKQAQLSLVALDGHIVYTEELKKSNASIDVATLSSGIYTLMVKGEQISITKKIVIQ